MSPCGVEQVEGVEPSSSAWKADVLAVIRHLHLGGQRVNRTTLHNAAPHCYFGNRLTVSPRGVLKRALVLGLRMPTVFRGKRNQD